MMADLAKAMEVLGYFEWSNAPNCKAETIPGDSGGCTKFGISSANHPEVDVQNLTLVEASEIYRKEYWDAYDCGEINNQYLATQLFLGVTNTSHHATVLCLQAAIHTMVPGTSLMIDGQMGPMTIFACNTLTAVQAARVGSRFSYLMMEHYKSLHQPKFVDGWLKRARWPYMTIPSWPNIDSHWRP